MINIIGMGPGDKNLLTLQAVNLITSGNKNYLRTREHGATEYFIENNIPFTSFDYLYDEEESFDKVYEKIVKTLIEEGLRLEINYLVPGDPLIAEKTVELLIASGEKINIVSGISFIEPTLRLVKRDPLEGLKFLNGETLNFYDIDRESDTLITQVYNERLLSEVKLTLASVFNDEYEIFFVKDAGTKTEIVKKLKVFELDREIANHQVAIYVPRCSDMSIGRFLNETCDNVKNIRDEDEILKDLKEIISEINAGSEEGYFNIYDII